jgi:hypothetical protein
MLTGRSCPAHHQPVLINFTDLELLNRDLERGILIGRKDVPNELCRRFLDLDESRRTGFDLAGGCGLPQPERRTSKGRPKHYRGRRGKVFRGRGAHRCKEHRAPQPSLMPGTTGNAAQGKHAIARFKLGARAGIEPSDSQAIVWPSGASCL